jgi:comEA protein
MAARPLAARLFLLTTLLLCVVTTPCLGKKKPPAKPVNINTATSADLQQVPGIGPATADKILQMRKSYGLFKSIDDLMAIRGIGPKRLEKMRKYLVVANAAPKKPAQTTCSNCAKPKIPSAKAPPEISAPLSTPQSAGKPEEPNH